jgi:RND family efflux transporter MFP subunit
MNWRRNTAAWGLVVVTMLGLAACSEDAPPPARPRLVRTIKVSAADISTAIQGTGQIAARYTANVGFQVGGRLVERKVDLGSTVKAGSLLARLDPADQQQKLAQAQAQVAAAQAAVTQTAAQEQRQAKLLKDGFATQAHYDDALRSLKTAQADLVNAQAQLGLAQNQLDYTSLSAPSDGVVTAVGPDPGQVISAGQMIAQISQPGELDAVFNISERSAALARPGLTVNVWLQSDETVKATGTLREIAPNADPVTRAYQVKVTLDNPPAGMRLGAIVVGQPDVKVEALVSIPPTAVLQNDSTPAVWLVDTATLQVHRRTITVSRFDADSVVVASGLKADDIVVTAGINSLAEGQKIRLGDRQ